MAMSKSKYLPEELISEIFYRLPVKSIGRCRCLSKHWRNFLSDPQFIKLHFNLHAHTQEEKLIIVTWRSELHTITLIHDILENESIDSISTKVNFQHLTHNWISVAGSCNGLVLVIDRDNVQFLINPTTLEYHKFPVFDWALPPKTSCYMYGLGYDIVSDDYKVVSLSYRDTNNEFMSNTYVDLYSVRKGHWETLGVSPYDHSLTDRASGVLVNGALHWLACRTVEHSTAIAAFDLSVDKFLEVPGPIDLQDNCFMCNLATLKGCLCISTSLPRDINTVTFWIMKEYGVKESWTKFEIIEPSLDESLSTLLCSITDEDDVLLEVDEEWVVYNLKENRRKDLLIDVNPVTYEARTFVDSLVSPYFGNETEGSCIV
ncbi:F-box/kelch-repeat protein At3g06240-like [Solanum stenotomum]|uniref:F-box/kelch-repeat protein At3g06240-like n=1 Tax=Solanum stenotomum TaxID=172797 RepID=UPI0020D00100|nr:F-box/kelch-repeat protein At3g06240-like [Solanum stenotomum]XP_049388889.1 F-box/kelch-repeat protein At3g06240-like [Solanum stenotomum]